MTSKRSKGSVGSGVAKKKFLRVSTKLLPTGEVFQIRKVHSEMTIRELRASVEFAAGVPFNMQKLRYLDEGRFGADLLTSQAQTNALKQEPETLVQSVVFCSRRPS